MSICFSVSVYQMDFKPESTIGNPTALFEGVVEESSNAVNLEVVGTLSMTSTFLNDTEASNAIVSNMDNIVSVEDKSDKCYSRYFQN